VDVSGQFLTKIEEFLWNALGPTWFAGIVLIFPFFRLRIDVNVSRRFPYWDIPELVAA